MSYYGQSQGDHCKRADCTKSEMCVCVWEGGGGGVLANSPNSHMESFNNNK